MSLRAPSPFIILTPISLCHSDPDSECNEEEGEESRSGQAPPGNPEEQNSKSEIRNTKQYQMTKIQMTKGVLSFEFRY